MRKNKSLIFLSLIIGSLFISPILVIHNFNGLNDQIDLSGDEASHYITPQSVTYRIETNFTFIRRTIGLRTYEFKEIRWEDRNANSSLTNNLPPYQEVNLKNEKITGNTTSINEEIDGFNNSYITFDALKGFEGEVKINRTFNITVNEIEFESISESEIGSYDYSDEIFGLYCNKSETYFDTSDPDLISLSNNLTNSGDNPVEIARKFYNWITDNIQYEVQEPERGASWAYDNMKGDCSEYADLMVTLLRIENIPARKVLGFVVSNNPQKDPSIGDTYNYYQNYDGSTGTIDSTLTQHAWIEYYVPNIGWIACDPTWGSSGYNYFNYMDFLHVASNVGAWFNFSGSPFSEFPIYPFIGGSLNSYDYNYNINITVIDTNLNTVDWILILTIVVGIIGIIALVGIIYYIVRRRKRTKDNFY